MLRKLGLRYRIRYFHEAEHYFGFIAPLGLLVLLVNLVCAGLRLRVFSSGVVLVIEGRETGSSSGARAPHAPRS